LTDRGRLRERQLWIAVTAVLAAALAWLATVNLGLLVNGLVGRYPETFVVLRALAHAALLLGRVGGPALLAASVTAGFLLALALRSGARLERRARHA
jgi:4-amino-4-deoxy-L-arabinose transferase-like glycosyltransferase